MVRKKLLVVDDVEINRIILVNLFQGHFDMMEAENGRIALELIEKHQHELGLILLDLMMPEVDGLEVLKHLNKSGLINSLPVILMTGEEDDEKALEGYGLGISDLIHKPFKSDIIFRRVHNVFDLYTYKNSLEYQLEQQKTKLQQQAAKLRQNNQFLIDALSTTIEFRSFETGEHIKNIRVMIQTLLEETRSFYPIDEAEIETIANASVLHDIGKIAIPDKVLLKPGPLTKSEFQVMKTHPMRGVEILENLDYFDDREYYDYCYEICRHHHERWDGNGYPDGLKGDQISMPAQVASIADVYDALTSHRVYKEAYSPDYAAQMILSGECGVFSPKLLQSFENVRPKMKEIAESKPDNNIRREDSYLDTNYLS